jgi:hypothetical protein
LWHNALSQLTNKTMSSCLLYYCSEHVKTHFHPTTATAATD